MIYHLAFEGNQLVYTSLLNKLSVVVKVSINTSGLINYFTVDLMRLGKRSADFYDLESKDAVSLVIRGQLTYCDRLAHIYLLTNL